MGYLLFKLDRVNVYFFVEYRQTPTVHFTRAYSHPCNHIVCSGKSVIQLGVSVFEWNGQTIISY